MSAKKPQSTTNLKPESASSSESPSKPIPKPPSEPIPEPPSEPIPEPPSVPEPPSQPPPPIKPSLKRSIFEMSSEEKQKLMKAKRPRTEHPQKPPIIPTPSFRLIPEQPEPIPSPTPSPPHTEEQTLPSQPPEPTPTPEQPSVAGPSGTSATFWPNDENTPLPLHFFQHFNLPGEDHLFEGHSDRQLLIATARHQGRALCTFSRLLDRQTKKKGSEAKLRAKYKALKKERKKIRDEKASLESSNAVLQQQIDTLFETAAEHKALHQKEVSKLSAELEEKTQSNTSLQQQNEDLRAEVHRQDGFLKTTFGHSEELQKKNEELQKKNEELQEQVKTGTPEIRQQILQEYQRSQELLDQVMEQYTEGFEAAVKKASEAGVDPAIFYDPEDGSPKP